MEVLGKTWSHPSSKLESSVDWLVRGCEDSRVRFLQTIPNMPRLEDLKEQRAALGQNVKRLMNLVITPDNVPDFTIPQSYDNYCSNASPPGCQQSNLQSSDMTNNNGQQEPKPKISNVVLRHPGVRKKESMKRSVSEPSCPNQNLQLKVPNANALIRRSHTISYEMIDEGHKANTNADPCSLAALSLPHLKTKTKFGFETLSECPTTSRKESLFHDPSSPGGMNRMQSKLAVLRELQNKKCGSQDQVDDILDSNSLETLKRTHSRRRNPAHHVAPLGVSNSSQVSLGSNLSSTGSSPTTSRNTSIEKVHDQEASKPRSSPTLSICERRTRFQRKRPATVCDGDMMAPWSGIALLGPEEKAEGQRRLSGCNISLNEEDVQQLWRVSALTNTVGVSRSYPGANTSDCNAEGFPSLVAQSLREKSCELKFSMEYSEDNRQLIVHLQEAVSLPGPSESVNSLVKLYLHPMNNPQCHTSNVIRGTNAPVYDQTFIFNDVTQGHLSSQRLRLKVLRKEGILRRNETIGEVEAVLSEFAFLAEVKHELVRYINTEEIPQELGRLQVKVCFQANSETLDVTLLQIKDIPCNALRGAPDPYVSLELRQPGRPDVRLQSKVKKKATSSAVNETFSFHISPRIEDLSYTSLSLTVYDSQMIRSDKVIGETRLGFGATEKSEFDHWSQVLHCPGREISSWHMLMEEQ